MRIIIKPTYKNGGKAIIKGKIYHYVYSPKYHKKMWIICGDCNKL